MTIQKGKRARDPITLAKQIGDLATGQPKKKAKNKKPLKRPRLKG